ncbi:MAG: YaaA family protein, partial [Bacteroidales bacterium]|nr:YaaA family protein [Bacteroidales bacterium]
MIIILSPSKTLENIKVNDKPKATQPDFLSQSEVLVERLRRLKLDELKELMGISPKLARLNYERYVKWHLPFDEKNSHPALLTFKGDVYEGIDVKDFTADDLKFAQQTVRILSGLYGVLRPLDLMQPYRLEMGTKIDIKKSKNLYEFWQDT